MKQIKDLAKLEISINLINFFFVTTTVSNIRIKILRSQYYGSIRDVMILQVKYKALVALFNSYVM